MAAYDPNTSILAGMSPDALQAALAAAQAAFVALSTNAQVATVSYAQGDGQKMVTYAKADLGRLMLFIKQLQAQLGIVPRPRRALTPVY